MTTFTFGRLGGNKGCHKRPFMTLLLNCESASCQYHGKSSFHHSQWELTFGFWWQYGGWTCHCPQYGILWQYRPQPGPLLLQKLWTASLSLVAVQAKDIYIAFYVNTGTIGPWARHGPCWHYGPGHPCGPRWQRRSLMSIWPPRSSTAHRHQHNLRLQHQ